MKVAITSTVVLDVPGGGDRAALERAFREANEWPVRTGFMFETSSGVVYRMVKLEAFQLEVRES